MAQMNFLTSNQMATEPPVWVDRTMRGIIFGGGALVLGLLVWAHLGLGALIHPPTPTALQQTAQAGPYAITFQSPRQLTARNANTAAFTLHGATGAALRDAQVHVTFEMVDMPMTTPEVEATRQSDGSYIAHPLFAMAGTWHMTAYVAVAGQPPQSATFTVSVRWS
ncbi:MAG: FixH family protein [Ktedonobacterales bacterium]|nr:FixH family protein [Ktedonobacterales bacterium]